MSSTINAGDTILWTITNEGNQNRGRSMKARVFYDKRGYIRSIVEEIESADGPKVGVQVDLAVDNVVVDLSGDLSKLSFVEIHSKYVVNPEDKKLKLVQNN